MKQLGFHKALSVLIVATAMIMMPACSGEQHGKPVVTVSIAPQRQLLEEITGDRVEINCLLERGGDPESYEPSMADMRDLSRSLVYMQAGYIPFERTLADKFAKADGGALNVVNTSEGLDAITGTHHHHDDHDADHHDHEADFDPHTWSSVKNARVMASNMLKAMIEVDPEGADFYTRNYNRLDARLDSIDRAFTARLAPFKGGAFMVWHPSLSYFARDYGLNQIVVGNVNKEVSIPALARSIQEGNANHVAVFFYQPGIDSRQVEAVNAQINARRVTINPLNPDWEGELNNIVSAITSAAQ